METSPRLFHHRRRRRKSSFASAFKHWPEANSLGRGLDIDARVPNPSWPENAKLEGQASFVDPTAEIVPLLRALKKDATLT